ncbi:MAG: sulfatase [Planctomyces sp.]|nr:sulfatase [Planctomyces sp.]
MQARSCSAIFQVAISLMVLLLIADCSFATHPAASRVPSTMDLPVATDDSGPMPGDEADDHRPNIILILADDLGWSDLSCYGSDLHETPGIDALAAEGIRFTHARAPSPVCTPTRASILTGKHPARLQMTIWHEGALAPPTDRAMIPATSNPNLPLEEITLAEHLSRTGYQTALVGKWHLGDASHAPETQGFDVNIGGTHWGAPNTFFWPYRGNGRFRSEFRYIPHLEFGRPGEYLTDRLTQEAIRVIRHSASNREPFFLMLAHHAPHTPIEAKTPDIQYFEQKVLPDGTHKHPVYAAMLKSLDESVQRIVQVLDELDLDSNTILIFTSDNGGYLGTSRFDDTDLPITSNSPLRSGKGTLHEGGLRVPLIIRWPEKQTGTKVCTSPVLLTDLFPTLLEAAGVTLDTAEHADVIAEDSRSMMPLLTSEKEIISERTLTFHYPHYYHAPPSTPASCIIQGRWKLIQHYEDERLELFDLEIDPQERINVANQHQKQATKLREILKQQLKGMNAAFPEHRN